MLPDIPDFAPRYNIAPSQSVPVIRRLSENRPRQLDMLRWGLVPHWAKDLKIGYKMINARAETITDKPSFRAPFKRQRCLVAAGGFFEWQHAGNAKQPFYIHLKDGSLIGFAGLWESWHGPEGETIETFTIITTGANKLVQEIHDRMPVIVQPENYDTWLGLHTDQAALRQLLMPYPAEEMVAYRVGFKVNSPKHDTPDCLLQTRATTLF